ncbi:MAG TPA: NB-ARC domain-containing protein [Thermoanaerobaculia bacterium]|nr:NB-ARC domain-containing protein [Thermoanaerobaculia bacterium]
MGELEMYSRQDTLTPTGYTPIESREEILIRRNRSKATPAATFPAKAAYRSMAPGLDGFVRRGELDRLVETLRASAGEVPVALVGPEGFGKTTLAQAACMDLRVRSAFPDGVLWACLGEALDAGGRLARVRDIVRWWTRSEPPAFANETAAGAHLGQLLAGSRVLLVLDGVTSAADLTCFAGLPAGAVLLATARDRAVLPEDSQRIPIGLMTTEEAVELLRAGMPRACEEKFQALACRLGNWPLLLAIVNGQIRGWGTRNQSALENALREVVRALDVVGLDGRFNREDPLGRQGAVWRAVAIALRSLTGADRDQFLDLAVFPAEEEIPLAVMRSLWGVNTAAARKLGKRLNDLALVARDSWSGGLRVHAVIAGFLFRRRRSDLAQLHGRLLDACRPESGRWADLPAGDAYLWRRLASHLLAAGRKEELRGLLLDFAFLQAKLEATDVHSLIADFDLVAGDDDELSLVREALRLSVDVLGGDPSQLAPQLWDRLLERRERALQPLLDALRDRRGGALAKPRFTSFVRPDASTQPAPARPRSKRPMAVYGYLAVSADGSALRVWDQETKETVNILEGHTAKVTAVALVAGRQILSGAHDKTLRLWDLGSGSTLRVLTGHTSSITALTVLGAHRAVSAALDGTVRIWDLDRGESLAVLHLDAPARTLTAGPDGRTVSARDDAGRTKLLELVEPE